MAFWDKEKRSKLAWDQEFEARTKVMPNVRFVANGEPLPREIGNVDKLKAFDGSGTYYLFPTPEAMAKCFDDTPEDPTLGQEAQGGPLHADTGRGEKYRGGNVETEVVADSFKNPQAEGQGSQTGGTGIQRAQEGDGAAIGSAVEDPDVDNDPDQHPDQDEAKEAGHEGTGGPANNDDGQAADQGDTEKKGGVKLNVKDNAADTTAADEMKQGEKTATDEAAEGAVSASHSKSDIEQGSPGTEATAGGKTSDDAGEGTAKDTENPTAIDDMTVEQLKEYLDQNGAEYASTDLKADLQTKAHEAEQKLGLAKQKSDEAEPTTGGGTLAAEKQ